MCVIRIEVMVIDGSIAMTFFCCAGRRLLETLFHRFQIEYRMQNKEFRIEKSILHCLGIQAACAMPSSIDAYARCQQQRYIGRR